MSAENPASDPRVSDEATGLPPIEEIGDDEAILVLAWASGEGVVSSPATDAVEPCRYLHLRGLAVAPGGDRRDVEWVQCHIAVPMDAAMDVALALMGGMP